MWGSHQLARHTGTWQPLVFHQDFKWNLHNPTSICRLTGGEESENVWKELKTGRKMLSSHTPTPGQWPSNTQVGSWPSSKSKQKSSRLRGKAICKAQLGLHYRGRKRRNRFPVHVILGAHLCGKWCHHGGHGSRCSQFWGRQGAEACPLLPIHIDFVSQGTGRKRL